VEPIVVTPGAPSAGGQSGSVPVGAPSAGGQSDSVPVGAPSAGGMPGFPGTLPALPPPGGCLGVTFPTAPDYPVFPGQPVPGGNATPVPGGNATPVPGGNATPVPAPPTSGACVHVAFGTSAHPNQPIPPQAPVMCAFGMTSPVSGGSAAPSAANESTPDEDLR
jgi:hypothetical protein